ncbi:MAG: LysR substrate-binding domain-containing protein [Neisseria sp.]|nr:LysR substrate-binding domain-containing protein [Neisseria sp.]
MRKPLPSLDTLHAFEAAARLGSFKQAAAELSVTATAVSHRIRALEAAIGRLLFVREVRAVRLNAEGEILFAAVTEGLSAIAAALERIRQPARNTVTLSVTPEFASKWLIPKLAAFQTAFPDIDLHVHAAYQPVNLNTGAVELAVRYGRGVQTDIEAAALFQDFFAPVASPACCARLGDDVAQWPLIHLDWHSPSYEAVSWDAWAAAAALPPLATHGGMRYSNGSLALQAAIAGQGVALLSLPLLAEELALGLLRTAAATVLPGKYYYVCRSAQRPLSAAAEKVYAWLLGLPVKSYSRGNEILIQSEPTP